MTALIVAAGMIVEHITQRDLPGEYLVPIIVAGLTDIAWLLT
jgi:hypothetical protein